MTKVILFFLIVCTVLACKKDKDLVPLPPPDDEEELITSIGLVFSNTNDTTTYFWKDIDGSGGNNPIIDSVVLKENSEYTVEILLLNESITPADTISEEVRKEAEEHQFFYQYEKQDGGNCSFSYLDFDKNNVPLGLKFNFLTTANGNGKFKLVLKHQPDQKPTAGEGNIAIGGTDVEVEFPVVISN